MVFFYSGAEIALSSTDGRIMWPCENDSGYDSVAAVPGEEASIGPMSTSIWMTQSPLSRSSADRGDLRALPMGKLLSQGEVQVSKKK